LLTFTNSVSFTEKGNNPVSLRNFSDPEDGFVWSHGRWSEIVFSFTEDKKVSATLADLMVDLDAFKVPPEFPGQDVFIYLNGLRVASLFVSRRVTILGTFHRSFLRPAENVITIETPDVVNPHDYGVEDDRKLGAQVFNIKIRPGE
jgi:hypothetical protein